MSTDSTPYGYCKCGCGRKTPISPDNRTKSGHVKGEPIPYCRGHHPSRADLSYTVNENGCWIPSKKPMNTGYVMFCCHGKRVLAHIYMWVKANGPVPRGMEIDHLCRNRNCCNPDHVEPVTRMVNSQRGGKAKLSPAMVREMRDLRSSGRTHSEIAIKFNVHQTTAMMAVNGRTWKNVE